MIDWSNLEQSDAVIIQHGLKSLGFYDGSTRGLPGPITKGAYKKYLESLETQSKPASRAGRDHLTQELIDILVSETGVREIPLNSNRGPDVEKYQASTWLDGSGWPWCAAFICWGIQQLDTKYDLPFERPETAGAWDFERWARTQNLKLFKPREKIQAGDILVYSFSHIGLAIDDQRDGFVNTVEGNTNTGGSREGGGVYAQKRKLSLIRSHIRLF